MTTASMTAFLSTRPVRASGRISWLAVLVLIIATAFLVETTQAESSPLLEGWEPQQQPAVGAVASPEARRLRRGSSRPPAESPPNELVPLEKEYSGPEHHAAFPESSPSSLRRQRELSNDNNGRKPPKFPDQTSPTIQEITGPFEMEIRLRIHSFDAKFKGYATVVNFSNGGMSNGIYVGAYGYSPNLLSLLVHKNDKWNSVTVENAVVMGREQTYRMGVNADGTMWISVDGGRAVTAPGVVPDPVTRGQKSLGASDFWNTRSLDGVILGLRVTNKDEYERDMNVRSFLANLPGQFFGAFRAALYVRVDNTVENKNDQGILDFYTVNGVDNARIVCKRTQMRFDLYQGGTLYSVVSGSTGVGNNSVVAGEMALWTIGVDDANTMYIEKNGVRLGSRTIPTLVKVLRRTTIYGNLASDTAPLDGVALGLRTEPALLS